MQNQESMFETPERSQQDERGYHAVPREPSDEQKEQAVWEEASEEGYEGYRERVEPYIDGGMRQLGDGKVYPVRRRPKRKGWIVALAVGLPLIFFLALGSMGLAVGRMSNMGGWDKGYYGWDKDRHDWDMKMHGGEPQSFQVSAQPTLIINDASGAVHIHRGDTGQVLVQAQGSSNEGDRSGGVQAHYNAQSNTVEVTVLGQPGQGFPLGDNEADLDITTPNASNIQVQTSSGDVSVDDVSGNLTLNTDSGSIAAHSISGQVIVNSGSGDVEVKEGVLKGRSIIQTNSGDVSFTGSIDPQGSYQIQTNSGDVNFSLPDTSSFALATKTNSGDVNNDFGGSNVGGNPRASLSISTDSGSINLRRAS